MTENAYRNDVGYAVALAKRIPRFDELAYQQMEGLRLGAYFFALDYSGTNPYMRKLKTQLRTKHTRRLAYGQGWAACQIMMRELADEPMRVAGTPGALPL